MPELPDVEGFRIALAEHLPGERVRDVQVLDAGVLRNATAQVFRDHLIGWRFQTPLRQGKWLILPTDGPTLLIHNGMTGRPYVIANRAGDNTSSGGNAGPDIDLDVRLVITTDRVQLRYADLRKLRGVWIVEDNDAAVARHRGAGTRRAGHLGGGIRGGAARPPRRGEDGADESAGDRRLGQHAQR